MSHMGIAEVLAADSESRTVARYILYGIGVVVSWVVAIAFFYGMYLLLKFLVLGIAEDIADRPGIFFGCVGTAFFLATLVSAATFASLGLAVLIGVGAGLVM